MESPKFSILDDMRQKGKRCRSFAQTMHPNPQFYKYYWWVFWKESTAEGDEFLSENSRLSTSEAMKLVKRLEGEKEPCLLYNNRLPRRGSIFDPASPRWQDAEWAPAFDDDKDDFWQGHK